MADFDDDNEPDALPEDSSKDEQAAQFEAELQRQIDLLPPRLYEDLKPLLQLGSVANYMLLGHPDDPVPQALKELLNFDMNAVVPIASISDNASLVRVMATNALPLFDFIMISLLVYESPLAVPLQAYLDRNNQPDEEPADAGYFMRLLGEPLLESLGRSMTVDNPDEREELRLRRLQAESIFARLPDTLRPYYPLGHSPAETLAQTLDDADEAADAQESAVWVSFSEAQRVTLGAALRLPYILAELGETPFARALAGVRRLRRKALERLATRLAASEAEVSFNLTKSELLRLYQAAQVCALSSVTDVLASGSLEDVMRRAAAHEETPERMAESAHRVREILLLVMTGFIEAVEMNHPDDEEIAEAKAEISQLAELLME